MSCDRCGWIERERDQLRRELERVGKERDLLWAMVGVRLDELRERAKARLAAREAAARDAAKPTRFGLLEVD